MINPEDLWVGDELILKKSGRKVSFAGINKDGRLKVKAGDKTILTTLRNVQLYVAPEEQPDMSWIQEQDEVSSYDPYFETTIDLHLDALASDPSSIASTNVLQFQLRALDTFLAKAIEKKVPYITIIHGKGAGVLRDEVLSRLTHHVRVDWQQVVNDGGAIQVKLSGA